MCITPDYFVARVQAHLRKYNCVRPSRLYLSYYDAEEFMVWGCSHFGNTMWDRIMREGIKVGDRIKGIEVVKLGCDHSWLEDAQGNKTPLRPEEERNNAGS